MMLTNEIKTLKSSTVTVRWMILKCRAKTIFCQGKHVKQCNESENEEWAALFKRKHSS